MQNSASPPISIIKHQYCFLLFYSLPPKTKPNQTKKTKMQRKLKPLFLEKTLQNNVRLANQKERKTFKREETPDQLHYCIDHV